MNPEIQKGFKIPLNLYSGLFTLTIFGNASLSSLGKPLLRLYFKDNISLKPFRFKCCFCLIKL